MITAFDHLSASGSHGACMEVLTHLLSLPDSEPHEDLLYAIKRLTRGLASASARASFAAVLSEVLARVPHADPALVMKHLEQDMTPAGSTKAEEEKQMLLGRVFALDAIIKSGRLSSASKSFKKRLVKQLLEISDKKTYLPELCFSVVCHLATAVCPSAKKFSSIVLKRVAPLLQDKAPREMTPELVMFLLMAHSKFGVQVTLFHSDWETDDLMCPAHWPKLIECFKRSSYTHPQMHSMWPALLDVLFQRPLEDVHAFYLQVVESVLFVSHVDSRKYLALMLLDAFIMRSPSAEWAVGLLGTPNARRVLVNHASKASAKLHKAAQHTLTAFVRRTEEDASFGLQALQTLLQSDEWENFDSLTRSHTCRSVAAALDEEHANQWAQSLMEHYFEPVSAQTRKVALESLALLGKRSKVDVSSFLPQLAVAAYQAKAAKRQKKMQTPLSPKELKQLRVQLGGVLAELRSEELAWSCVDAVIACKTVPVDADDDEWRALVAARKNQPSGGAMLLLNAFRVLEGDADEELTSDIFSACDELASGVDSAEPVMVLVSALVQVMTEERALYRTFGAAAFAKIAPIAPPEAIAELVAAIVSDQDLNVAEVEEDEDDEEHGEERVVVPTNPPEEEESSSEEGEGGAEAMDMDTADPAYLKMLDASLAAVVQQAKATKSSKKSRTAQLVAFKCRVLDLFDVYARAQPNCLTLCTALPELMHKLVRVEPSQQQGLFERLLKTLVQVVGKGIKVPPVGDDADAVNALLASVWKQAARNNPTKQATRAFGAVCSFMARALGDQLDLDALQPLVKAVYLKQLLRKNARLDKPESFFAEAWTRVPAIGLATLSHLAAVFAAKDKGNLLVKCRSLHVILHTLFLSSRGKKYMLDNPGTVQRVMPAVDEVARAWILAEATAPKHTKTPVLAPTLQTLQQVFALTCNPRMAAGGLKPNDKALRLLVSADALVSGLEQLLKRHPQISRSKKFMAAHAKVAAALVGEPVKKKKKKSKK